MHFINNESNTNQAMWVATGRFSSFALSLVSAAILSRYFDKTEYGTYRQIIYVYNTLLVIFTAGLPRVFSYFLPRYSLQQGKDVVRKISLILFIAGTFFSLFLFVFSGLISDLLRNPELSRGLKYFSPIPMLLLPTLGIEGIFSTYKKTFLIAIYNILTRILMLLFIVLPVIIFKGTYLYAVYGWLTVSLLTLFLAWGFKGIPFSGIKAEKSGIMLKEILNYSIPIAVASLAGVAIKSADQFYVSRYFGTVVFAEFSNGFIELPFAHMITGAVATVLMPLLSKAVYSKTDLHGTISLWQRSLEKSAIFIYPLIIFFMFNASETITILYSEKYFNSSIYFIIALNINFFNIVVFAPLILSMGETRFYALLHICFAAISWIMGYFVILVFNDPVATAIFSAIQSICMVFVAMIFTSRRISVKLTELFPVKRLLIISLQPLLLMLFTNCIFHFFLPEIRPIIKLTFSAGIFIPLMILTAPLIKINYLRIFKSAY